MNTQLLNIDFRSKQFVVNEFPTPLFWDAFQKNKWEPDTLNLIDYYVTKGAKVIDLGCSYGPLSLYMAQEAEVIYAIDPDPVMQKYLISNLELNPSFKNKIVTFNKAITPYSKKYNLSARQLYGTSSSSILDRTLDRKNNVQIEGITFKDFLHENKIDVIDFMKIDIEGGEFLICDDIADQTKNLNFPTIYIELHTAHLKESMYLKFFKNKALATFLYKLNNRLKINLFEKQARNQIENIITKFSNYKFVYYNFNLSSVAKINRLHSKKIKSLIFTNKEYKI